MDMLRRALVAAFAIGVCACTPAAPPPAPAPPDPTDPVAVIAALYQPYLTEGANPPAWYDAMPMTPELSALVQQTAEGGEVGAISIDPIIAAQDFELSQIAVGLDGPPADGRAIVSARFTNLGNASSVHYDMQQRAADGAWLVDNVRSADADLRLQIAAYRNHQR